MSDELRQRILAYNRRKAERETALASIQTAADRLGKKPTLKSLLEFLDEVRRLLERLNNQ